MRPPRNLALASAAGQGAMKLVTIATDPDDILAVVGNLPPTRAPPPSPQLELDFARAEAEAKAESRRDRCSGEVRRPHDIEVVLQVKRSLGPRKRQDRLRLRGFTEDAVAHVGNRTQR